MHIIDLTSSKQSDLATQVIKIWNNSIDNNCEYLFWKIIQKVLNNSDICKDYLTELHGCETWHEFARDAGLWNWFYELENSKLISILNVAIIDIDNKLVK